MWHNSETPIVTVLTVVTEVTFFLLLKLQQNSKTQIVTKLKQIKLWQNWKTKMWQKSKAQIVTSQKLKLGHNSETLIVTVFTVVTVVTFFSFFWNCDKTQKLKLWPKLNKSNCDKTQKDKLWQNSKTQILTKIKNSICDKTQELKLWPN